MRRPSGARPSGSTATLQIAPLIDAVFLLLTYFLFTISLATVEGLLPSELATGDEFQQQQTVLEQPSRQLVVRLVKAGSRVAYFVDDWPAADIEEVIARFTELGPKDVVVIDADSNVAYQYVVSVYNQSLKAGVRQVVFPLSVRRSAAQVPRS